MDRKDSSTFWESGLRGKIASVKRRGRGVRQQVNGRPRMDEG